MSRLCRDHGDNLIMEGQCHSGQHKDCHGSANQVTCCQGHYEGREVAASDQCTWEYFQHGQQMECGGSDEIIVGRCGSGRNQGEQKEKYSNLTFLVRLPGIQLSWQSLL